MKLRPALLPILALVSLVVPSLFSAAYDSPNFDEKLFDRDGIFLPENERQSLLEALASIASNFSDNNRIDADLKEKALAISLTLDPIHARSRMAHRSLLGGKNPPTTGYFENLSTVTETLWTSATRLLEEPIEPEEAKLAPLLMELSLLTHPSPPEERLRQFARVSQSDGNPWLKTVFVQPDRNKSTLRIRDVRREADQLLSTIPAPLEKPEPEKSTPKASEKDPKPSKPDPGAPSGQSLEPISIHIPCVLTVASIDSAPIPGVFMLELRPPTGDEEREAFSFLEEPIENFPTLPLLGARRGFPLEHIDISGSAAKDKGWNWPKGFVGAFDFRPADETGVPGPRRLATGEADLALRVALESALGGGQANPSFTFVGTMDPATSFASLNTEVLPTIDAAKSLGSEFVLLPSTSLPLLVQALQRSGEIRRLFDTELVAYQDSGTLAKMMNSPTDPALLAAVEAFAEVEAVSDKLPIDEFTRNPKVQERLELILSGYPGYLSAAAMLEYGRTPIPEAILIESSVRKIDELILPYFAIRERDFDFNVLKTGLDDASRSLSLLRTDIHPGTRDYYAKAEDLLEAAELYLSLTNLTSSMADQRLREVEAAADEAETYRENLGFRLDSED